MSIRVGFTHIIVWGTRPILLVVLASLAGLAGTACSVDTARVVDTSAERPAPGPAPIASDQIGAVAGSQYKGDGLSVLPTPGGARLRSDFQKLNGDATRGGLWVTSTVPGEDARLRLMATGVGRGDQTTRLAGSGTVVRRDDVVAFVRRGLTEEYATSVDGVRQDFIIDSRPAGAGPLHVDLGLAGATATQAPRGAKLTLDGSGRELAYSRLHVVDATGRTLTASLEVPAPNRIAIRVQDADAVYPVRIDPTFSDADWVSMNPGVAGTNNQVFAMVTDASGNLYIGGFFTLVGTVPANNIAKWDGTQWTALGSGANNSVGVMVASGNDIYVGGSFAQAGGVANTSRIAKWNGSAWSALGTGANTTVAALALSGGTLYAGGSFTSIGGVTAGGLATWNGTSWSAFGGSGANGVVNALATIGTDVYMGCSCTMANGVTINRIGKWNGTAWSALGAGSTNAVFSLAVMGGNLYAGTNGSFTLTAGGTSTGLAMWNPSNSTWTAVGASNLNSGVFSILATGGNLYIGGQFTSVGGVSGRNMIARWNGSSWSALSSGTEGFLPGHSPNVTSLAMVGSDLWAGGTFLSMGGSAAHGLAKWDGSAWSPVATGLDHVVNAMVMHGTTLYIAGNFISAPNGVTVNRVAKWNGTTWSALGTGVNHLVNALAVDSSGNLYAGGRFSIAGGVAASLIAKWNGAAWSAMGSGISGNVAVSAIGVNSAGHVFAGGNFTGSGAGGVANTNRIAMWNGTAWSALGTGFADGLVSAIAAIGTDVYVGGTFTMAGTVPVSRIAKWNGSGWSALGTGMNSSVSALTPVGTNLYAGGAFTIAGGVGANRIAKWDGSTWSTFGAGLNATVGAIAVDSGGRLYVGGNFSTADTVPAAFIAKWDGAWSALGSGVSGMFAGPVTALAADASGHLFVGGNFTTVGAGLISPYFARADVNVNHAPVANAGADQAATATSASGAAVVLNGAASSDSDGDALTYAWTNDFDATTLTGSAPSTTVPFGAHVFTLTVTDSGGMTSTDTMLVTVSDALSVSAVTPPQAPATYTFGQEVPASYSCTSSAGLLASCTGTVANGSSINTASLGAHNFAVTVSNTLGDSTTSSWTYTVTQASSVVTVTCPTTVTYTGTALTPCTAAATGAGMGPVDVSASLMYVNNINVGTVTVSASWAGDANHTGSGGLGNFAIGTKALTATFTANSKVYDGTTAAPAAGLSCSLSGVFAGDTGNVVCTPSAGTFDSADVGSPRVVTANLTLGGSAAGNYTFGAAGTTTLTTVAVNAATSTTASVVYGQAGDFTTVTANTGGLSADSISSARGVAADANGNIYVADRDNNRVLFFPFGQTTATRVYGQGGSFTTNTPDNGGVSANSLDTPNRVTVDSTGVYISDAGNFRVLYFSGSSTTATRVYGQGGSFTSSGANTGGVSADSLGSTRAIAVDPAGNVYIADGGNHRILFYPTGSTTATRVYGQAGSFTTNTANNGGVSANSLFGANGIRLDTTGNLYVADQNNHRVLVFPAGQTTATVVYGQGGSFTTNSANNGGVSAASLSTPGNLALDGGNNLYLADSSNNRVLFYASGQTTATAVYGQAGSFLTNTINNGGVSANSLRAPNSADLDFAGNIYVSDIGNNRLLRFNGSAPAITPALLTVTASSTTKTYGTTASVTPSYSGFVNGESTAVLSSPATCSSAGTAASAPAGTYPTTCTGAAGANYSVSYVAGTLTVEQKIAAVTPNAASKTYGGVDPTFTGTLSGFLAGDGVTATYTRTAGETVAGGPYTISATLSPAGVLGNYTITYNTAAFTISKANQTISVAASPSSGVPDTAFSTATGTGFNDRTIGAAVQADGKIIVGGTFSSFNGVAAPFIVRLHGDGTRDTGFSTSGSGFNHNVNWITIQPDGKMIVAGAFTQLNGGAVGNIARLNADGTPDAAFTSNLGTGFDQQTIASALQPDGKIVVVGLFTTLKGLTARSVGRLNADGTPDNAFRVNTGTGFNGDLRRLVIQPDGKIVVVGNFTTLNGVTAVGVARLNADGTPDTAFNANLGTGFTGGQNLHIGRQSNGQLVVGGTFTKLNGVTTGGIARLNPDGTPDTAFNVNTGTGIAAVSIAVQSDDKIIATGTAKALTRLNADGTPDTTFNANLGGGLNGSPENIVLAPDGTVVLVNSFTSLNGATSNRIARLMAGSGGITKTYGDAAFTVSASASSGLPVSFSSTTPSVCTVGGSTVTIVGAGSCAIAADQAGDSNYHAAPQVVQNISVGRAPLSATLLAAGKTYDGTTAEPDASMSCSLTGVLAADTSNVVCAATSGTFNLATVGSRTVTATVTISGTAAGNYTLGAAGTSTTSTSKTATAAIAAKAVTATVTASNKTYNGNTNATISSCTLAGVVSPDTTGCAASAVAANNQFSSASVGTGKTVTANAITLTNNAAGNYTLTSTTATTTANITTAALTATLTAASKMYDGTATVPDASMSCTVTGVIAADVPNVACTATNGSFDAATVGAGTVTATVSITGVASGNYTLGTAGTTLSSTTTSVMTNDAADAVWGQNGSFTTATANNGGLSATSLSGPSAVTVDRDGNVYATDQTNNRVLFFPAGTTTATRVYGQGGSFTSSTVNTGGISADSLNVPIGVAVDASGVYIADSQNNRVLFYPGTSTTATRVYGQIGSFVTNGQRVGPNAGLRSPSAVILDGNGNLYVADPGNARVLFFPAGTTTPTRVYGAGNILTVTANNYPAGVPSNGGFLGPAGLALDATDGLYVADKFNSRVLYFPAGTTLATRVYGQAGSFTTGVANLGGVSANSLSQPDSVLVDRSGNLYVSDRSNHRVLFFTPGNTTATRVYGQSGSLTTNVHGGTTAARLSSPSGLAMGTGGSLYVADLGRNRLVRFDGAAPMITTVPVTATLTAAGKVYDGTTTAPDVTCTVSGVLAMDAANVSCAATGGSFDSPSVGPRTVTATVTIGGPASGNYTLGGAGTPSSSTTATASATISKAAAIITVSGYSVTFDGVPHTATGTALGVLGEDLSALLHLGATTHTNAGDYLDDSWTFDGDANYTAANGIVIDTIAKASSTTTVTCSPVTTVYTGAAQELCAVAVTGAGGLNLTPAPTYTDNTNVGTATASYNYAGDANHDVSDDAATFAITKATSTTTVTCSPGTTVYSGAAQELCAATVTGVGGLSLTPAPVYADNTNVGTATASYTYAGDANHDVSDDSATFAITKANSTTTVTCAPTTTVYTGAAQELCAATVTGVGGLSLTPTPVYADNTNVGTATASYSYAGDANHDVSDDSATFAITKATTTTTVTCAPTTTIYTGAAQELCAATVTGVGGLSLTPATTYTDNINVGTATASYSYAGDANHDVSDDSATFAITKATSTTTVTCAPTTTTYTGAAQELCAATVAGVGGLSLTPTPAYTDNTNVGTATASYAYAGDANHDVSTASATFAITLAPSATTVTCSPVTTVYTGVTQELCSATVTGVGGLNLAATPSYANNTNVGTATASYSYAGDANHDISDDSATFAITKATSTTTVTCAPTTSVYTGAAQELCAATVTGVGGLSLTPAPVYTDNTNVGTATASYSYAGDANHDLSNASATFAITKATSTTSVTCSPVTTVYTGAAHELCAATVTGVGGLNLTPTPVYTDNTNVGTATASYSYVGDANHDVSDDSATFAITKATSTTTVTCAPVTTVYTGAAQELCAATVTGVGGLSLTPAPVYTDNTNVGTATASYSYAGDANHDISDDSATFAITKATSTTTVTCAPTTTIYTGAAQELCAATVTGVGGLSLTPTPTYTDNINVGTATASYSYAGDANHDVSNASATFAITKATSTTAVTCAPLTTVYTGEAQELCAATVTGVGGLSLTPTPTYADNFNVGTATASYSYTGDANHDVSDDSATFAITKAGSTTTVTCTPVTTVYTGAAQELCAATVTGVGGLSLTPTPVYTDNTNVGTATASYAYAGDANHDVSDDSATFAITKATSTTTVTCSPVTTVYTGAAQELCAATVTGVGGLSLAPTPVYTDNTNVGTATASYSYAGDANHDISDDSATFAITKATSTTTVTCAPTTTIYTGAAQELCAATVTGVGGLSLTPAPTYTDNINVGTATASYSYAGDANHDVSDDSATFAITKATSTTTVTCAPTTTTYTGAAQELCAATVAGVGGLSLTPTPVYADNTNVGTATASYSYAGDANHDVSDDSATFAITKATTTTTVTCAPTTTIYTGAAQELCAATVTGVGGLSLTPAPTYTDNINVGTATASYSYAGDANHDVSDDSATFAITKATSTTTVTCSPVTTVYTGAVQELCAATVTGVGGLSLAPTPVYTDNMNVGTATASYNYAGDANHDISDDSATFAITKATSTTTVTCAPVTTVFTGAAQENCAATVTGVGGLSQTPTPTYTDNVNVGTATASYAYAGDANHDVSDASATFAITKATSTTTVTCAPTTTTYTGAAQELCAATVTGVGGLSLTPTPVYVDNTNVGTATASYSYAGDENHDISDDSATFAITKATSTTTVTCAPVTTVFTGAAQELCAATVTGVGGLSQTPTPTYTDNVNVGTATASYAYAGDANHDVSDASATFAITKATSTTTVTCAPTTTTYTGAAQELCAATVTGVGGLSLTPTPVYVDNTNVGTATASYSYAGDANHDISDDSATFAITKATSTTTVTCAPTTTIYTGAAQELCSASVTGVGGLSLTPAPVYTDNTNVGTATASYSYAGDANHDISDDSATFAITKATSTTTVTCSPVTTVYSGAAQELCAATVTGVGGLSLTPAPTYTDNINVGTATASYSYTGDANHDVSNASATFAITKATSTTTVTCAPTTTIYTGAAQELCAATVTGVGGLSLTPTPVYTDNMNVGTATASYSYAGDANHDVSDDSATFAITKATSTTTVTCSPVTTVYTGAAQELCAATVAGVGGLSLTPTPVYTDNMNVGTATASYNYAGDANHDISDDSATFAITKATSTTTVTCSPATTVYTGAAQELCAATVTGVGGLSLTPAPVYSNNTNVGTATASYSYTGDANHDISDDAATFAITKATSMTTVTCSPLTTVYSGAAQELCAATVTGVGGLSLTPTPSYADNTNVGTATASYSYAGDGNHDVSNASATFAITKATSTTTVTCSPLTTVYSGAAQELCAATVTGVGGLSLTPTPVYTDNTNVGTATASYSYAGDANHDVSDDSATFAITKATSTTSVTCSPVTTVYTGAAQELCAATVTGVGGLSLTPAPVYIDNTNVGTATASYSYAGDANHDVSNASATFAITKATSTTTVTCAPVTTVYTGLAQELCAATVTGVGGLSLTPAPVYTDNTNVGTATASYSYAGDANHDVSDDSATFAITKATSTTTVTCSPVTTVYTGAAQELCAATVTGVGGLSLTPAPVYVNNTNVGTATASYSYAGDANHDVSDDSATFAIAKATSTTTVTCSPVTTVYNGVAQGLCAATVTGVGGLSLTPTPTYTNNTNVGTATASYAYAGDTNHDVSTASATFAITLAPSTTTVTCSPVTTVYSGAAQELCSATVTGVGGLNLTPTPTYANNTNVGTATASYSYAGDGNHDVSNASATFAITKATSTTTVTCAPTTTIYTGAALELCAASVTGVGGLNLAPAPVYADNTNVGTATASYSYAGDANHDVSDDSATFAITKATSTTTVTCSSVTTVYTGVAQELCAATVTGVGGLSLTPTPTYTNNTNVGTATASYAYAGDTNHDVSTASATFAITLAPSTTTVTCSPVTTVYSGAAQELCSATVTGVGGLNLTPTPTYANNTNVGTATASYSYTGDANHDISDDSATFAITKATSTTTVTCSPVTTVYTGAAQELCAATVTGVGGLSLAPMPTYADNTNVGTATASYSYAGDANHDVSDDSATFAITKATSTTTVTCAPVTTVYTGAAQELCAATVTGVGGLSLTPTPVYTDNMNVGTATASYSYAGDANHDVSDDSATFAITKATSTTTVTCAPTTTVYTGAAQELCAATVTGVGGLSLTPTPVYTDNTNVGTATASYAYAGDENHDISDDSATFAITKATSTTTVACSPVTTVYTGAAQELCAATVTGVGGLSLTPTPVYADNTNVGTATASYAYAGDANHEVSDDAATFAITKATSTTTVTCAPTTAVYTGAAQELCAATVTGVGGLSLTPAPVYTDNMSVGTATASYSYAGDANHDVSDDSATFAITKATSTTTVTCAPTTTIYTGAALELCAATVTGVGGLNLAPAPVYADNTNVGTATASYSYAGDANHDVSDDSATFAITKATSTTTVTCSPLTTVYSGAAQELCAATVTGVGGLSLTPAPVYTHNTNVGTATASYSYAGDANHDISDDSATFAITKATSTTTVTCAPVTTVFTGAAQELCAATVTGVGGLSLTPTPVYADNTNVGTATASYSYAGDANHDVSDDSATFAITKATSTTTVTCAPVTTVYTGAAQELCAATVTGVGGLSLTPTPVYTDNMNVGTATASYSYAGDANHDVSDDSATFAITKATSTTTVTCAPTTTVYTGAAQELCAATVTGVGGLSLTPTPVYTDNTNVGTATASYSYAGDANHDLSNASATFAITKATSTTSVTCSSVTTVYTGAAQELCAATVMGVGGLNLTPTPVYVDNTNVGTATASYSYAGDANHDVSDDSATFAITKATSTTSVTCAPLTTVYTGAAQELCAATVTGVGGLSLTPAPVYTDNMNVGTATASYSYAGDANHDISDDSATFAITKATSTTTVTCAPVTTVFTGAAQELCSATVTGVGGLSLTPTPVYVDNTNVGTATASYSYAGDANHDISDDSATFAITKATSTTTVTCAPVTTVFTGAAQELCSATVTGVGGLSLTPAPVYTDNTNVGTASVSAAFGGDSNHEASTGSSAFTITPAALTATADSKSKLLGAVDPALTYQVTGLMPGDTATSVLTGALTRDAGEAVGTYTIRQGTLTSNSNYTLGVTTGTLAIGYNTCLLYDPTKAVKSGATIPIKIKLCSSTGANVSASNIVVTAVTLMRVSNAATADVMDAGNANADGNFRFDPSLGPGYIFNLKTTGMAQGTYRLELWVTNDPQPRFLTFQVR